MAIVWVIFLSSLPSPNLASKMPICGVATEGCPSRNPPSAGCDHDLSPEVPLCYGFGFDGCSYNKGGLAPGGHPPNCDPSSGQLFNIVDEPSDYSQAARDWMAYADQHATEGSNFRELVRQGRVTTPGVTGDSAAMCSSLGQFFGACSGCHDPNSKYYIGTISFHAFATNHGSYYSNVAYILDNQVSTLKRAFPGMKLALTNFGVLGGASSAQDEVNFIETLFSQLASASDKKLDYVYYFAAKDYGGGAQHNGLCEAGIKDILKQVCSGSQPEPTTPRRRSTGCSESQIARRRRERDMCSCRRRDGPSATGRYSCVGNTIEMAQGSPRRRRSPSPSPRRRRSSPPPRRRRSSGCKDASGYETRCQQDQRANYCHDPKYEASMKYYCKKSCGFCGQVGDVDMMEDFNNTVVI